MFRSCNNRFAFKAAWFQRIHHFCFQLPMLQRIEALFICVVERHFCLHWNCVCIHAYVQVPSIYTLHSDTLMSIWRNARRLLRVMQLNIISLQVSYQIVVLYKRKISKPFVLESNWGGGEHECIVSKKSGHHIDHNYFIFPSIVLSSIEFVYRKHSKQNAIRNAERWYNQPKWISEHIVESNAIDHRVYTK